MQVSSLRSFEIPITPRVHVYDPNQGLICKCIRWAVGRDSRHTPVQVCDPIHDTVCNPVCRAVVRDPQHTSNRVCNPNSDPICNWACWAVARSPNTPRSKSVNRDRAGALFSDVSGCFGGSPATPPPNPLRHTEIPLWEEGPVWTLVSGHRVNSVFHSVGLPTSLAKRPLLVTPGSKPKGTYY